VKYLSINELSEAKTLYEAKLDSELKKQVKDKYPHLLKEPEEAEEKKQSTVETSDFDIQDFLEELGTPPSEKE
jgi:uncharacterized membrane protein